jgi:hypothetical protein
MVQHGGHWGSCWLRPRGFATVRPFVPGGGNRWVFGEASHRASSPASVLMRFVQLAGLGRRDPHGDRERQGRATRARLRRDAVVGAVRCEVTGSRVVVHHRRRVAADQSLRCPVRRRERREFDAPHAARRSSSSGRSSSGDPRHEQWRVRAEARGNDRHAPTFRDGVHPRTWKRLKPSARSGFVCSHHPNSIGTCGYPGAVTTPVGMLSSYT